MAFELTDAARQASQKTNIEPQIVLEIDGVSTIYGARITYKKAKIGDTGLLIGGGWKIGGNTPVPDQSDLISLTGGTSTSIKQQLQPDKGLGSGISSMQVALVDKDQEITQLISPGIVVSDILGRKARVYLGFNGTAFPDDYITVFRGIIDDIQAPPGMVLLNLAHPDQLKRQTLFAKTKATLNADMTNVATGMATTESLPFYLMNTSLYGGDGLITYVKIDNEWMKISSLLVSPHLYSVTRAQLGTTAAAHTAGAEITAMYSLKGNVIDLALWLMLSSPDGLLTNPYLEQAVTSVNYIDVTRTDSNAIFFRGLDMVERYGVSVGDIVAQWTAGTNYISTVTGVTVTAIEQRYDGTIITLSNDVTLTTDTAPGYSFSFYSQYAVMPTGLGLAPDEVDIDEHLKIKSLFLSSADVEIYLKDELNAKDLIEQELYGALAAYSLPRKSKASVGLHHGPIPGQDIKIFNQDNIRNPSKIRMRRSLANNFYNTIIYKFDQDVETDDFLGGDVTVSAASQTRIPVGTRARVIEAKGLRTSLNGLNLATTASNRLLNRYKYGAEYIENLQVTFRDGFNVEIGDTILLDPTGLQILNSTDGDRSPPPKLFEVMNKSLDLRTGDVVFSILDTNYSTQNRYGLISPSSKIKAGISHTKFIIEAAYNTDRYGSNEYLKWQRFVTSTGTVAIKVTSPNFTTRFFQTTIKSIDANTIEVNDDMGFTPQAGDIMSVADYDFASTTAAIKALYAFMKNSAFADGGQQYLML